MTGASDSESIVHLAAIRRALANGNAALMVGAGFSRNADGGHHFKTWDEIADRLWAELNPGGSKEGFSTSLVTRLAEQYARIFSPPAFEDLLKQLVPDDKASPGRLHDELLRLPWSEIFTTNYDTLLERAADKIIDKAHYTVVCREDIPQSQILNRRRIVKLHGSFPSQRPFIFTEEDYRTYPERFAPFVNLVRQSLLENVFCLIGFSGDDPNFLHWIGWVRDMLDRHALPIYLFVTKPPSLGDRKLLEARRVTPVLLPAHDGSAVDEYQTRFLQLFRRLAEPLKPADTDWGDVAAGGATGGRFNESIERRVDALTQVFPRLTDLRRSYPGWLVAPAAVRRRFERSLNRLEGRLDDLKVVEQLARERPIVCAVVLEQYSWHQDVLLQCFDDRLAAVALDLIKGLGSFDEEALADSKENLQPFGVNSFSDLRLRLGCLAVGVLRLVSTRAKDCCL